MGKHSFLFWEPTKMDTKLENLRSTWTPFSGTKVFGSVLLLVFLIFQVLTRNKKKGDPDVFEKLPGPKSLPFIGALYAILCRPQNVLSKFLRLTKKYGPIYRFDVFQEKLVILSSPETTQKLLSSTALGHLRKAEEFYRIPFGESYFGNGLVTSSGKVWKSHRNVIGRVFTHKWYQSYMQIFNEHSHDLIVELGKLKVNRDFDSKINLIHETGFKIITEFVYGEADAESASEFSKGIGRRNEMLGLRLSVPILLNEFVWRLHPYSFEFDRLEKKLKTITHRLIENNRKRKKLHEEGGDDVYKKTMIDGMLAANMSNDDIMYECNTMITAGFDSSSWTIVHCLFFLATHPLIQAKCRKEVERIFLNESKCPNGDVTMEALAEMEILERCLQETLRLVPLFFLLVRKLEVPLKLEDDIELPTGTCTALSPWLLHRNEEYFPDPEKFDPDRFLPENIAKRHPYSYIPFSMGMRGCIGVKFAMLEMKTVVAHVLFNFEVSTEDQLEDIKYVPHLVVKPEREYRLRFIRHMK